MRRAEQCTPSDTYLRTCRSALAAEQAKSLADTDGWAHVDKQQVHVDWDVLYKKLAAMLDHSDVTTALTATTSGRQARTSRSSASMTDHVTSTAMSAQSRRPGGRWGPGSPQSARRLRPIIAEAQGRQR